MPLNASSISLVRWIYAFRQAAEKTESTNAYERMMNRIIEAKNNDEVIIIIFS
jgi:hypothetical protein